MRRMQKRMTGELMLRDRRWSSLVAKAAQPQQRQVSAAAPWPHSMNIIGLHRCVLRKGLHISWPSRGGTGI
jgi:hypothetical protein